MATPSSSLISPPSNFRIEAILHGTSWDLPSNNVLTYAFHNFGGNWSSREQSAVNSAFKAWENVANIDFVRINSSGSFTQSSADIAFVASGTKLLQEGAAGVAFYPRSVIVDPEVAGASYTTAQYPNAAGDIFIDNPEVPGFN